MAESTDRARDLDNGSRCEGKLVILNVLETNLNKSALEGEVEKQAGVGEKGANKSTRTPRTQWEPDR